MINHKFVDSIKFCLISYSGCLGPSGYIFFMDDKGDLFSCNYDSKLSKEYINLKELCTKLKSNGFDLDLERVDAIKDWESLYLGGYGNYLYIHPKYVLDFYRLAYGESFVDIFKSWKDLARYILCTQ